MKKKKKKPAGNFLTTNAKELGWVEKEIVDVSFFMFFFFPTCILFSAPRTLEKLVAKKIEKRKKLLRTD